MIHQAVLKRFAQMLNADLRAYRQLAQMLDEQFAAALRVDSAGLKAIGAAIIEAIDTLNARPNLHSVLPAAPSVLIAACAGAQRAALQARWRELKALVERCKALNLRNGQLITSQFEIMQRALHGEKNIYVPG